MKKSFEKYYDVLMNDSPEETKVRDELRIQEEKFHETPEYKKYSEERKLLQDKLSSLIKERHEYAKSIRPERKPIELEDFANIVRENKKDRYASLSENAKNAIKAFNELSNDEQETAREFMRKSYGLDKMNAPKTTEKDIWMLLAILGETCKDFVEEKGLDDIYGIHFSITEPTGLCDATAYVEGIEYDEKAEMNVRKEIGFACC